MDPIFTLIRGSATKVLRDWSTIEVADAAALYQAALTAGCSVVSTGGGNEAGRAQTPAGGQLVFYTAGRVWMAGAAEIARGATPAAAATLPSVGYVPGQNNDATGTGYGSLYAGER